MLKNFTKIIDHRDVHAYRLELINKFYSLEHCFVWHLFALILMGILERYLYFYHRTRDC